MNRFAIVALLAAILLSDRRAGAAPPVHLQNMEFQAPKGWTAQEAPDSATLSSADGQVTVVVTPNGLVDASNVDDMVGAGPILPFFVPRMLGSVETGARPEKGFRAATFEMSTLVGPSYIMRLIFILTDVGTFMVLSKATKERGRDGVDAANGVLHTFKVSPPARAAAARARREAAAEEAREKKAAGEEEARLRREAREQAARQAAFAAAFQQRAAGRYDASFGPYDDKTYVSYWVCGNGRYLVERENFLLTSGPLHTSAGVYGNASEFGSWSVGQDESGPFIRFAPSEGAAHAHRFQLANVEHGNPRIQGLQLPNALFERRGDNGCRNGM